MNTEIKINYLDMPKSKMNPFCDKHSYDNIHSQRSYEPKAEPVSELTPDDKHKYYVMLKRFGVPKEDAQKAVAIAEIKCTNKLVEADTQGHQLEPVKVDITDRAHTKTATIRNVIGDFKDLINHGKRERIPVTQDIVSFERRS